MRPIMAAGPRPLPSTEAEETLWAAGRRFVAGVDEVGRGPLAGPVFAGAVILDSHCRPDWLTELRDSKELPAPARERLAQVIRQEALAHSIGWATVAEIDAWGITVANRIAMGRAVEGLTRRPQHLLIDGPATIHLPIAQRAIVDGDATCMSIAAASIIAKVARDALMCDIDQLFPAYGFARNKGYSTPEHLARLAELGPCVYHRRSWLAVQRRGGLLGAEEVVAADAAR
jgi:ribonuclease HII